MIDLMAFLADCKKTKEQNLNFEVRPFFNIALWDQLWTFTCHGGWAGALVSRENREKLQLECLYSLNVPNQFTLADSWFHCLLFSGKVAKFLNSLWHLTKPCISKLWFVLDVQILVNYYFSLSQKTLEPSLTFGQSDLPLGHNANSAVFWWAYSHCSQPSAVAFFLSLFQWQSIFICNLVNWTLILLVWTICFYPQILGSGLEECIGVVILNVVLFIV